MGRFAFLQDYRAFSMSFKNFAILQFSLLLPSSVRHLHHHSPRQPPLRSRPLYQL